MMRMNAARQQAMLSQPLPFRPDESSGGFKRQKLSKYERKLAEEEEREAKWQQYRAQKQVASGAMLQQPGSFPLFRPPLPPAKPAPSASNSAANSSSSSSKWLSEGEKLALYRSLSYPPHSLPAPTAPFLSLLDAEIAGFVQSVAVADDERQRKRDVLERIKGALQPLWPSVDVQPVRQLPSRAVPTPLRRGRGAADRHQERRGCRAEGRADRADVHAAQRHADVQAGGAGSSAHTALHGPRQRREGRSVHQRHGRS